MDYGLNQSVSGMTMPQYMAHLLEENESQMLNDYAYESDAS